MATASKHGTHLKCLVPGAIVTLLCSTYGGAKAKHYGTGQHDATIIARIPSFLQRKHANLHGAWEANGMSMEWLNGCTLPQQHVDKRAVDLLHVPVPHLLQGLKGGCHGAHTHSQSV